jgi:hypothetical protein
MANASLQIGNGNWAIKEDNLLGYSKAGTRFLPIPITMTRATLGTRVNPSGLIEDVALLGDELVTDGNFPTPNTEWSSFGLATINENIVNFIDAGSNTYSGITQDISSLSAKQYKVEITVTNWISGNILAIFNSNNASFNITGNGTYSVYLTPVSNGDDIELVRDYNSGADFSYSITNVSVKEATIDGLARVDYTDGTGSLLVEPQRTNLITYSEDFTDGSWIKDASTITPNAVTSPDGTLNADKIIATATNSSHSAFISLSSSTSSSTSYCYSFFAKAEEYTKAAIRIGGSGYSTQPMAVINLSNGSIVSQQGFTSISVANFDNQWYKISAVFTATSSVAPNIQPIADGFTTTSDNYTYTGDGTSGIYIYGAQFEQGSYPTSYIKTQGSTVTRNQDEYTKTGISDKINSEEGVLFFEMAALSDDGTLRCITLSDGGITNRVLIIYDTQSNSIRAVVVSTAGTSFDELHTVTSTLDFHKIAIKWKLNDFALWIDGVEVATDTSGAAPIGLDRIVFDVGNGTYDFYGKVKQLQIFKTALSDSELATLTS